MPVEFFPALRKLPSGNLFALRFAFANDACRCYCFGKAKGQRTWGRIYHDYIHHVSESTLGMQSSRREGH